MHPGFSLENHSDRDESTLVENNESPYLFLYFASIHDKNHIINSDATVNQREK